MATKYHQVRKDLERKVNYATPPYPPLAPRLPEKRAVVLRTF